MSPHLCHCKAGHACVNGNIWNQDLDHVVYWLNFSTMGCVPAGKLDFVLSFLTGALTDKGLGAVAVILHPNRSSHNDNLSNSTPSKAGTVPVAKEEDAADDDCLTDADMDPEAELRSIMHDIVMKFSQKDRGLRVRPFSVVYDKGSLYGQREAAVSAFLVTANHPDNVFWGSVLWKHRVATGAVMLSQEAKRSRSGVPVGAHFTDTHERKQHVVNVVLDSLLPDPKAPMIFVDHHHGYDGFLALACFACTICHEPDAAPLVADRVGQFVYTALVYKQPLVRLVDLSQGVDRAASSTGPAMWCITPGRAFFSVKANRLLTPGENMIMMSLPILLMGVGCNTGAEVESVVGNAMHVKA